MALTLALTMRIEVHKRPGGGVGRIGVDPKNPPPVVRFPGADGRTEEHYLEWDRAFDDEGNLRRCPVCASESLYARRTTQPITGFLVTLVVGLLVLLVWGVVDAPLGVMVGVVAVVGLLNLLIILFGSRHVGCYRCGSRFFEVGAPRGLGEWDAAEAERHRESVRPMPKRSASRPAVARENDAGDAA